MGLVKSGTAPLTHTRRLKKCILFGYRVLWFLMQHYCDNRESDMVLIKVKRMERQRLRGGNVWGCLGLGEKPGISGSKGGPKVTSEYPPASGPEDSRAG